MISNGVINFSPEKPAVFREALRVLEETGCDVDAEALEAHDPIRSAFAAVRSVEVRAVRP